MPQATRPFEFYEQVPFDSVLEVQIEPEDAPLRVDASVVSASGPQDDEQWNAADVLKPATGEKSLTALNGYFVRVSTFFQGDVDGRLNIRVVKPDGQVHSKPWFWPLVGANGGNHLGGVFIKMATAGGGP